jgi:tetratricopeptide (TPR) repeat protein
VIDKYVIAAVLLGASVAGAQAPSKDKVAADAAYAVGQERYAAGDYLVAADRFEAAYALDPDPAYLFNIAQAYRFGNACAKAAASYRKFINAVANAPNAAKVQQFIEQSDECAKKQAEAQRPPPPLDKPVVVTQPPPPPPAAATEHPGRNMRIAGLSTLGVGAVVLGIGSYYAFRSFSLASDREAHCRNATPVGGLLAIGGVVLYYLGRTAGAEHSTISVIPTASGAMAVGAFTF